MNVPRQLHRFTVLVALAAAGTLTVIGPAAQAATPVPGEFVTVEALDPYLEYPAIALKQAGTTYPNGPQTAVFVAALDPTNPRKQVFVSNFAPGANLYGFDAATGTGLPGFSPAEQTGAWSGISLLSAVPMREPGEPVASGAPVLYRQSLFEHHGTGTTSAGSLAILRMLDAQGGTRWSSFPTNTSYGPLPFPAAVCGSMPAESDGVDDAALFLDEENYRAIVRSASQGGIFWDAADPYGQQVNAAAVADNGGVAYPPAFVFCRGRGVCLLEKRRIKDGTLLWQSNLGSAHIFNFVAAGDLDGIAGDEIVAVPRLPAAPWHALIYVLDGGTGALRWSFDLGEDAGWAPAPTLADLDGDGLPEVIVQTASRLHAVKYLHGELPGWPVETSTVVISPVRSQAVVGDLDGDSDLEVAIVSKDANIGAYGTLDIFDAQGRREYFAGSVLMNVGAGLTPAIADVDADGHNELILGSSLGSGSPNVLSPSLWTLDFSRGNTAVTHGAIAWGQYGADAQHSARALSPTPSIAFGPRALTAAALPQATASVRLALANRGARPLTWSLQDGKPCGIAQATWLHPTPTTGVVPGGRDQVVDMDFDATGLAPGRHETIACLTSNDAAYGAIRIPVRLDVTVTGYRVDVSAGIGGRVSPATSQVHAAGAQPRYLLEPDSGYLTQAVRGCSGTLVANEFVLDPLAGDCVVEPTFWSDRVFADAFEAVP